VDHAVRVRQRQRNRLFDQHRLSELDRLQHRREMLAFAGGHDDRIHLGARDDLDVVAGVELRAGLVRELARARRIQIRNRKKLDCGVPRGEPRAQRTDAAGPDYGQPEIPAFDGRLPERGAILA